MSCSCDNNPLILPVGATGATGPKGDTGAGAFEYFIGEEFGGGVVFHVYRDADGTEHGLIVSKINQSASSTYSYINSTSIGASTTWDGTTNTNLMSTQVGAISGAWLDCTNYSITIDSITYDDWYLPSITELLLLGNNRFNVFKTFSTIIGAVEMGVDIYWSSSEFYTSPSTYALAFDFGNNKFNGDNKYSTYFVRAIRKF